MKNDIQITEKEIELATAIKNIGYVEKETATTVTFGGGKEYSQKITKPILFYNSRTKKYKIQSKTKHIKLMQSSCNKKRLSEILEYDFKIIGFVYFLIENMSIDNQICSSKGIVADKNVLYEMTTLSEQRARKLIKKIKDLHLIAEHKIVENNKTNISYFINPIFAIKDNNGISTTLYKLFKNDLDEILTEQAKKDFELLLYIEKNPFEISSVLARYDKYKERQEITEAANILATSKEKSELQKQLDLIEIEALDEQVNDFKQAKEQLQSWLEATTDICNVKEKYKINVNENILDAKLFKFLFTHIVKLKDMNEAEWLEKSFGCIQKI